MCAPRNRTFLFLGLGVVTMGMINASIGLQMLGERGDDNRAKMRAWLASKSPPP